MVAYDGTTAPTIAIQFLKSGTWTSVTAADVISTNIRRGRSAQDQRDSAGTATIQFNNSNGYYDPDYTGASSPWVISGASILRAGLQMRVQATWSATAYTLYQGYLDNTVVSQGNIPLSTMQFVDGIALIAEGWAPDLATASFAETAATRVGRMLDYAGWSASARSLTGTVSLIATAQGKSCMRMIYQCVDSIAGRFYISRSGVATLVPLADKFSRPTQMLFSDAGAANSIKYEAIATNPGTQYIINKAVVTRGYNSQYTSVYTPSSNTYGVKTVELDAPVATNSNASNLALYTSRYMALNSTTSTTFVEAIQFSALRLGTLYPDFLSTELADQVSVQRTTYDGRSLQWDLVVEGVSHSITKNDWIVTLTTSSINPYSITI
jgi:hypothetical protein